MMPWKLESVEVTGVPTVSFVRDADGKTIRVDDRPPSTFRDTVVYPDGTSRLATDEDRAIWEHVKGLERLAEEKCGPKLSAEVVEAIKNAPMPRKGK